MMILGVAFVLALVLAALWIWSLVDALRIADQRWAAAGQNKMLWVGLIVLAGVLGSLLYVLMPRKALVATTGAQAV